MPERQDVERIREHLGDRAARRYRAITDLHQCHLSDYRGERR